MFSRKHTFRKWWNSSCPAQYPVGCVSPIIRIWSFATSLFIVRIVICLYPIWYSRYNSIIAAILSEHSIFYYEKCCMAVVGQLTGGRLYDRIHYCLYLNNTHSGGVGLQQTKERKYIISQNQLFFLKWEILLKKNRFYREKNWLRSVNSQSMRRRYKNIAGLTCYIQLNGKQTKRPPHLLHCRRGRSTLKPLSLQLIFILCPQVFLSKSNVPCLLVLSR